MKSRVLIISSFILFTFFASFMPLNLDIARSQSTTIAPEEHLGEVAIPQAIKGFDEQKVKKDPVCDSSKRPEITSVKPDEVRAGDKIIITGRYFGKTKECLRNITIGSETGKETTYVNDETLEVTVPDSVKPGMTFLNVQSGGGAARSAILVEGKK